MHYCVFLLHCKQLHSHFSRKGLDLMRLTTRRPRLPHASARACSPLLAVAVEYPLGWQCSLCWEYHFVGNILSYILSDCITVYSSSTAHNCIVTLVEKDWIYGGWGRAAHVYHMLRPVRVSLYLLWQWRHAFSTEVTMQLRTVEDEYTVMQWGRIYNRIYDSMFPAKWYSRQSEQS